MPISPAPTPAQISNRQLTGNGQNIDASTYNDQAAKQLNSYVNSGTVAPGEANYENTILGNYNANKGATENAYQNELAGIHADYQQQLANLGVTQAEDTNNFQAAAGEAGQGAAYNLLKDRQAFARNQMIGGEARAAADAATARAGQINSLTENYNNALETGRSAMASQLGTAATLQTPEEENQLAQQKAQQAATVQLMTEAPDAGITPGDDFATATAKYRNSRAYRNNIGQGEATIASLQAQAQASEASASASAAQAAQTRRLTEFMGNVGNIPKSDPDVQYLLNGGTTEGLTARYAGTPQAVKVPQIIQAAQGYGFDQNKNALHYQGQQNTENAQTSGSIYNMGGAAVGRALPFVWNALSLGGNGNRSLAPSAASNVTPSGISYTIQ
ncbi:MAG: hypothetical protein KGI71_05925 [Patescibacteria group bacterium]|nr:hypothetical protein [Patescibacteria group bacterium]